MTILPKMGDKLLVTVSTYYTISGIAKQKAKKAKEIGPSSVDTITKIMGIPKENNIVVKTTSGDIWKITPSSGKWAKLAPWATIC